MIQQTFKNIILFLFLYVSNAPFISGSSVMLKSNAKVAQPASNSTTAAKPSVTPSTQSNPNNFFDIFQNVCNAQTCPLPFAYCSTPQNCHCSAGYAHVVQVSGTSPIVTQPCQYTQKKQLVAFLLEFFFPFGVGHLYSQRTLNGVLKLCFVLLTPCLMCCLTICGLSISEKMGGVAVMALGVLYSLGTFAWLITDLILFGINKYSDGNGVPLMNW